MTDHVHEWGADVGDGIVALCKDPTCHESLDWDEIDRRLNATERLSAEDAIEIAKSRGDIFDDEADTLEAYAAALEGEDDLSKLPTQQKPNEEDMEGA